MRVVFDTNVLIDGFEDDFSAQAKLIDAVRDGELTALITHAIEREYRRILGRLIEDAAYRDRIEDFLDYTEQVTPLHVEVVLDDPEDEKFIAAAAGGQADAIITRDRHLLDVGEVAGIRIVTAQEGYAAWQEDSGDGGEWTDFVKGIGIGSSH